jgi:DNA-binding response OmpR family regulator
MTDMMSSQSTGTNPSILIIDDEDYIANLIASTLQMEGFDTYPVYNGRQALLMLNKQTFSLILADIMMPYSREFMDLVLGNDRPVKTIVFMLSAMQSAPRLPDHITFVPKPFILDDLVALVKNTLDKLA